MNPKVEIGDGGKVPVVLAKVRHEETIFPTPARLQQILDPVLVRDLVPKFLRPCFAEEVPEEPTDPAEFHEEEKETVDIPHDEHEEDFLSNTGNVLGFGTAVAIVKLVGPGQVFLGDEAAGTKWIREVDAVA
jgi:hypothetical protein